MKLCRGCGKEITDPRRRTWCSRECVEKYLDENFPRRIKPEEWAKLTARYKGVCESCGKEMPICFAEIHHRNPFFNGGPNTAENLMIICSTCHKLLHGPGWKRGVGNTKLSDYSRNENLLKGTDQQLSKFDHT